MRLSIQTPILLCKILVGNTQTLELHPGDADYAIASLLKNKSPFFDNHIGNRKKGQKERKCQNGLERTTFFEKQTRKVLSMFLFIIDTAFHQIHFSLFTR